MRRKKETHKKKKKHASDELRKTEMEGQSDTEKKDKKKETYIHTYRQTDKLVGMCKQAEKTNRDRCSQKIRDCKCKC